jgi:hypothetical protein
LGSQSSELVEVHDASEMEVMRGDLSCPATITKGEMSKKCEKSECVKNVHASTSSPNAKSVCANMIPMRDVMWMVQISLGECAWRASSCCTFGVLS